MHQSNITIRAKMRPAIGAVIGVIAAYLIAAFVSADIGWLANLTQWLPGDRVAILFYFAFFGFIGWTVAAVT